MRPRRLTVITPLVVALTVLSAGIAHAAWLKPGSGSGSTSAASLVTPVVTATRSTTAPTSAIDLSWTAAGQLAGTTYQVRRDGTLIGCSSSPCTDGGRAPNTTYSYVVTAVLSSWTRASVAATASTQALVTPAYTLSATPGTITAGGSTSVVITARGSDGLADPTYNGAKTIAWSGNAFVTSPSGAVPTAATSVTFTNGVSTAIPVTLTTAGSALALTATSGSLTGTTSVTVAPGAATRLAMTSTTWSGGVTAAGCTVFACTRTNLGNNGSVTTRVSVTDNLGNIVSNLGTAVTVTLSQSGSASLSPTSLTIPGSGTATSTATVTLQEGNGNYNNTLTAASLAPATYTSAATTIKKGS